MLLMQRLEKHDVLQTGQDHYIFDKLEKQKKLLKSSKILPVKAIF